MGGNEVPKEWIGGIKNITYSLGGIMSPPEIKVKIATHNYFDNVKSSNVIGYIRGSVEPDRYVFLGNHRDAWGYGAVDPSSGTCQLLEVARIFGTLIEKGKAMYIRLADMIDCDRHSSETGYERLRKYSSNE